MKDFQEKCSLICLTRKDVLWLAPKVNQYKWKSLWVLCMTVHNRLHLQRYWQRSSTIEKLTIVQYIFIFVIWIYDQYILRTYETFSEKSNKTLVSWKWQRVFFFLNEARRSWKRPYSISLCVYVFWYHKETQKWMIHFERSSRKSKFDSSVFIKTY